MARRVYEIQEQCNSCGACKVVCPKHCISKGRPYKIKEEICIGCGRCTTRCWRGLIKIKEID